jgi:hypothetical protein
VKHFAILAKPLTSLLKKHTTFLWTSEHQAAFEAVTYQKFDCFLMCEFSQKFKTFYVNK